MQTRRRNTFTTIRTEGAILPPDLLLRISEGDKDLKGLLPTDYHLLQNEKLNEAINRSWNRLFGAWENYQTAKEKVMAGQAGTTETRERWLLPLFQELGFGRLQTSTALTLNGKSYPITHIWGRAPIHLLGFNIALDKRTPGVAGAAQTSPHSMLQEFLNRSDDHLWGFLSNGLVLRILRDNVSLTRQAYVEFDLQGMMEGEVYADFVLLWMLCHQSRVEGEKPEDFWLEQWSRKAQEQGTRALDQLRDGVEDAISALGTGFLIHPANQALRGKLRDGSLNTQDYYRQLLRLVYRLIFLFVAEDRDLLFPPDADLTTKKRYTDYYSTQRLRRLAERSRGSRHADLFHTLRLVTDKLGNLEGCAELALPALGGFLFSEAATPDLNQAELPNQNLLDALRALAYTIDNRTLRTVDYKNLGPEELGSVYESLLELHPEMNVDAGTFTLTSASGHERKTTGSYYTPGSLIQVLLDSALDPVIDDRLEAVKGKTLVEQEQALLDIKVCDPASGSGHFLISAAHRIAKKLASVRSGDDEPSPESTRQALRDVISQCIYGVDVNPMAVELCKVSLWMEALEPGKPLSFLDAHIKCGNSLVGVGPGMDISEIPDDAFQPAFGDDKETATALRRRNKREREGQLGFRWDVTLIKDQEDLARWVAHQSEKLERMPEKDAAQIQAKEKAYSEILNTDHYQHKRLKYNMWTAAFFWSVPEDDAERMPAPTQQELLRLHNGEDPDLEMVRRVQEISEKQRFFHWELEFPLILAGEEPGFDVVIGNPPWERIKLEEKEWFSSRDKDIANAKNSSERNKLIGKIKDTNAQLYDEFCDALHDSENLSLYFRNSDRYKHGAVGDINTFSLFADLFLCHKTSNGISGFIVPTSLISDYTYKDFFVYLSENGYIRRVIDFVNTKGIFPQVDRNQKFCILIIGEGDALPYYSFGLKDFVQVYDPDSSIEISQSVINLVNPNTRTCPAFQSTKDAVIITDFYSKLPILKDNLEDFWQIDMWTMFHMSNDSKYFVGENSIEKEEISFLGNDGSFSRLYEGKMIQQFDHRYSHAKPPSRPGGTRGRAEHLTTEEKRNPSQPAKTRYVVDLELVIDKAKDYKWFIGYREVAGAVANIRSMTAAILPLAGVGHKILLLGIRDPKLREKTCGLLANLNSLVYDYVLRQKMTGTSISFYIIKQIPTLPPETYSGKCPWSKNVIIINWITSRVLELVYTSWDLESFAKDMGYYGPPLIWDPDRRQIIQNELDAMYFYLYGCNQETVEYILNQFTILENREISKYGEYRTKLIVLYAFDRIQEAIDNGEEYISMVDPPPAHPSVAHLNHDGSVYDGPGLLLDIETAIETKPIPSQPKTEKKTTREEEIVSEDPKVEKTAAGVKSTQTSDYSLYKCKGCGQMVMGFDKENHRSMMHDGKEQEFVRL